MTAQMSPADELAGAYARASGLLPSPETLETAIRLVAALAAEALPDVAGAGVTVVDESGGCRTCGASDAVVDQADALQYELGEGPCLVAWEQRTLVRVDDLATDGRWPRCSDRVRALGVASVVSAPLVAGDVSLGALKVYRTSTDVFDGRALHLLTLFAAQATLALAHAPRAGRADHLSDELREALRAREVISQAKGILMEREHVDEAEAMARLLALSRRRHRPVREVAQDLVASTVRARS